MGWRFTSALLFIVIVLMVGACSAPPPAVAPTAIVVTMIIEPTAVPASSEAATTTPEPIAVAEEACYLQAETYIEETEELIDAWYEAFDFEGLSPTEQDIRDRLPRLEGVRARLAGIEVPECAAHIHAYHLAYMDKYVETWNSSLNGDSQAIVNYKDREVDELYRQFEGGFMALQNGIDLALYPTPTPRPIVAGADDTVITLPTTLTILPSGDNTDIEVRDSAGGNFLPCRLEGGIEVEAVEASWDSAYLRVEGTDCDGWVVSSKVTP